MVDSEIDIFYDRFVNGGPYKAEFTGHFDLLSWKDLQKNLSACERLQRKPIYKIALVSGNGIYQSKSEKITISGYTIIFSDPLARFAFTTNDLQFAGKYCICNETFLCGTSRFGLTTLPVFKNRDIYVKSLSELQYNELMVLFEQIGNEHKSTYPFKEQVIRNRIFDVIHYVQKLDEKFYSAVTFDNKGIEDRFIEILENAFLNTNKENMLKSKSPSYFARMLNTTVDHLNRELKIVSGKTTQTIVHERIIEEANVLLKHSGFSIKEIAWCLHFQEASHFQNFYKRRTGFTPVEYRLK